MMRNSLLPVSVPRRALVAGVAVTATLVLSACGGSTSGTGHDGMTTAPASAPASAATFNDADVAFAQAMIPHHRQAVQMAAMADGRAAGAEVKTLAGKIQAAQQPEIDTMNDWLTRWNRPTMMPGMSMGTGSDGMGHGSMAGMMTAGDLDKLEKARGTAFDKQFLTMMISHHQGAITMAQQETERGVNPDAVALAKKIITDQQAQITEMRRMLTTL